MSTGVVTVRLGAGGMGGTGARDEAVGQLVQARVASRTSAQDPDVWGPAAREEAAVRLGWTRLHTTSRHLPAEVAALRAELLAEGVDRVVLAGMGGSSLAPEVICAAHGVPLVTLDATDPGQVRAAMVELERTVLVVSSKSGGTVETDSQRRAFVAAFEAAGIDPARRVVVVTDPGSPLEAAAREAGHRVFLADPTVGGRYSALTAFGLVPSGLAGADTDRLLDEAAAVADACAADSPDNPALQLAAVMAATPAADGEGRRDKLVLVDDPDAGLPGLGDWAEQLVAESTGKAGTGVLPVVVGPGAPEVGAGLADVVVVRCQSPASPAGRRGDGAGGTTDDPATDATVVAPLGAQLLVWEHATAAAGVLLGINPFDQPDVESAKQAARGLLERTPEPQPARAVLDGVDVVADEATLPEAATGDLDSAVQALLGHVGPRGYLAVMVYLDRLAHAGLAEVRDALATRTGRPVTFGWGPRFLHSTGQLHKGGPATGVFLQVVGDLAEDLEVPGREFTFGRLKAAQADGDAQVLRDHGRPVLTLRVGDEAGLEAVAAALRGRAV